MIEFWKSMDAWQKVVLCVLVAIFLINVIAYLKEMILYRKRRKIKEIPLTLKGFTEDNFLIVKIDKKANLKKMYRIYLNDTKAEFKFDVEDKSIFYVKADDIFENTFNLEFCMENGFIFAKGKIQTNDAFPRPYEKKTAEVPMKEEPIIVKSVVIESLKLKEEPIIVKSMVIESLKGEFPKELAKEEPVVTEPIEEEPVAEEPVEEEPMTEEPVEEDPVEEEPMTEELVEEEPVEEEPVEEEPVEEENTAENDNVTDESEVVFENGKKIVISYNYSFSAKLIQSDEIVRDWYNRYISELDSYIGLKYRQSWKRIRVYKGRKTLASVKFRGKKLCVAYALDPKKYENTKYNGIDMSDKITYLDTPMLLKTTSERKFLYQLHLLNVVCRENEIEQGEVIQKTIEIPAYMDRDELIEKELVKVYKREVELNADR